MKVLVLEDDPEDWLLLQRQVKDLNLPEYQSIGYDLVSSLTAAREKVRAQSYDFIIADYYLPDGEALEFLLEQMRQSPELYALLVSNDEQLVTVPAVGELLRSNRVSFCVKSDLDGFRLQAEIRAAYGVASQSLPIENTKSILLVDDDPQELEILRWHCEQIDNLQVETDWASDTSEALKKASARHFTLILVDFRLQGELGTETIVKLRDAGVISNMFLITDAPSFLASHEAMRCLGHRQAGFISKRRLGPDRILQALQSCA